jgi:hypothetical protein
LVVFEENTTCHSPIRPAWVWSECHPGLTGASDHRDGGGWREGPAKYPEISAKAAAEKKAIMFSDHGVALPAGRTILQEQGKTLKD